LFFTPNFDILHLEKFPIGGENFGDFSACGRLRRPQAKSGILFKIGSR